MKINFKIPFLTALIITLASSGLFADAASPDEELPKPPHDENDKCKIENFRAEGFPCASCTVWHIDNVAHYDSCEKEYKGAGYTLACGSEWIEIWCLPQADGGPIDSDLFADEDDQGEGACSVVIKRNNSFLAQVSLLIGLILFGFIVYRRSRS